MLHKKLYKLCVNTFFPLVVLREFFAATSLQIPLAIYNFTTQSHIEVRYMHH